MGRIRKNKSPPVMSVIVIFLILLLAKGFVYKTIISADAIQRYQTDKSLTSWQPTNENALSGVLRSPEFTLGFDTPYNTVAQGRRVSAPYNLFKLAAPHQFGFELSPHQETEFSLKPNSYMRVFLTVDNTDVYLNNQRPRALQTEWVFTDNNVIVKAGFKPVRGIIAVTSGSYDYIGYEGLPVHSATIPAWSVHYTGYKGIRGQTVLLESAIQDSTLSAIVYTWNPYTKTLEEREIKTKWFFFWKFHAPGDLVIRSKEKPFTVHILPQSSSTAIGNK